MAERPAKRSRIIASTPSTAESTASSSATRVTCTNNNARRLANHRNVIIRTGTGARDTRRSTQQMGHSQVLTNTPEHNDTGILDEALGNIDVEGLNQERDAEDNENQKDGSKRPAVSTLSCIPSV